jgi:O-antigen ligase
MAVIVDRAVALIVAATIFAFACGSTIVDPVLLWGRPARWVMLGVYLAAAIGYAVIRRPRGVPTVFVGLVSFLGALAVVSALWSVDADLTFRRAVSFVGMLAASSCLLAGSVGRGDSVRRLLVGIAGGAAAVAFAGLVVLADDRSNAIQPASTEYPARYRGFEQNPNTAAMLLAIATPIAVSLAVAARSRRERAAALAAVVLFGGSLAASGARGPMLAAFLGTLVAVLSTALRRRDRAKLAVLAAAGFVLCIGISRIPQPQSARPGVNTRVAYSQRRTLFTSSGRLSTWGGAIRQAEARPTAGYGFGTEATVFVNRSRAFVSDLPENSYIGAALQLGLVGLLLLIGVAGCAGATFALALARLGGVGSPAAAAAGALVAALTVGVTQSYIFSVGNVATVSAWLAMFLLAGVCHRGAEMLPPEPT